MTLSGQVPRFTPLQELSFPKLRGASEVDAADSKASSLPHLFTVTEGLEEEALSVFMALFSLLATAG